MPSTLQEGRGGARCEVQKARQATKAPGSGANSGGADAAKVDQESCRATGIKEVAIAGGRAAASQAWW